eukprot:TRINITY_DN6024_c0_g1_i1.p1 TRINITY_DN6024_c0_g1~~TRINITY_DN6024_c0_g1_i1.p1  ORF type:complete len:102 (-),score=17.09 TRINITY_DN6024_c0_g1_i1:213-518(-)
MIDGVNILSCSCSAGELETHTEVASAPITNDPTEAMLKIPRMFIEYPRTLHRQAGVYVKVVLQDRGLLVSQQSEPFLKPGIDTTLLPYHNLDKEWLDRNKK